MTSDRIVCGHYRCFYDHDLILPLISNRPVVELKMTTPIPHRCGELHLRWGRHPSHRMDESRQSGANVEEREYYRNSIAPLLQHHRKYGTSRRTERRSEQNGICGHIYLHSYNHGLIHEMTTKRSACRKSKRGQTCICVVCAICEL